ncbi:MAG: hypothetical protein R2882_02655 [Gemmatimonadales bacterium]
MIERSPFLKLDKATVIGELKSVGTRDPDVLHNRKVQILSVARFPKQVGIYLMVVGGLCTILILLAFIGIPLLGLGWWTRRRGVHNLEVVDQAWQEFQALPARQAA